MPPAETMVVELQDKGVEEVHWCIGAFVYSCIRVLASCLQRL